MTIDLRTAALDIFQHALHAVDACEAVRRAINLDGAMLRIGDTDFDLGSRPIYLVGIGKAALAMTLGLKDLLGDRITRAVISTSHPKSTPSLPSHYTLFFGGHPLPNQESFNAASATFELLTEANHAKAFVIFLVSGGGSAMLEQPISGDITLEDLQEANRQLITSGATIAEINAVRRSISAVKGGGLAARLPDTDMVTLIVSDTNAKEPATVASGPTLPVEGDAPDSLKVIETCGLIQKLPKSTVHAIRNHKKVDLRRSASPAFVLLDNSTALEAAKRRAEELGFSTTIASDIVEEPIARGTALLIDRAFELEEVPSCLISGGEFSCAVTGNGRGGRNLETLLRCAIKLDNDRKKNRTVVLSAGTDGIDGSSFAAGGIADETTVSRARELEMEPEDFLERSDSHAFFEALGDLIVTGPTGTNVRDIRFVLREG